MKTVLTDNGLNAAIQAGLSGPHIQVAYVKIGSAIITPSTQMTDVTDFVWEGDSSYIQYQIVDDRTFLFKVTLDEGIGNFDIGNIGLFLTDGTMFTLTTMDKVEQKIKSGDGGILGNRRIFEIPLVLTGISGLMDVTLIVPDESSLPFVLNESSLPSFITAPFSVYEVQYHTKYKSPVLALRTPQGWAYVTPTSMDETASFEEGDFGPGADVGKLVYFDINQGRFLPADGADNNKGYLGVRGALNNIVNTGVYYKSGWGLSAGMDYYADTGTRKGDVTTIENNWYVGTAIDANTLYLGSKAETIKNKVTTINTTSPSTFKYPSESALVTYVKNTASQLATLTDLAKKLDKISTANRIYGTNSSGAQTSYSIDNLGFAGDIKASVRPSNHGDWLLCNGQAVSRTTYAELFNIIGINFGSGNGSTTFNVPDYRGKFLRGLGGDSASSIYTTQQETQISSGSAPNFGASISVSNFPYTIPTDGWLWIRIDASTVSKYYLNNILVYDYSSTSKHSADNCYIPVKQGMVLTQSNSRAQVIFFPN